MLEKMQFVSDAGLSGIELDYNHYQGEYGLLNPQTREELVQLKKTFNTDYPALAVNSLCEFGMSQANQEAKVKEDILGGIDTAAFFSIPIVQLPSFFAGDIVTREDLEQTCKNIQFASDAAAEHGIIIGSENALNAEKQLELITRVNRENFKIYFDCRNSWWMKGIPAPPILREVLSHVCEVHLKDGIGQNEDFTLLGEGDCGAEETLAILNEAGYQERILLENNYIQFAAQGKNPLDCVKQDMAYIHDRMA